MRAAIAASISESRLTHNADDEAAATAAEEGITFFKIEQAKNRREEKERARLAAEVDAQVEAALEASGALQSMGTMLKASGAKVKERMAAQLGRQRGGGVGLGL